MDRNILRRLTAAANFSPALLEEVADAAGSVFEVGAGEILLHEGEKDDAFVVIIDGRLQVLVGNPPVVVAEVGSGAMLGEISLFGPPRRSATVITTTKVTGVIFQKKAIDQLRRSGNPVVSRLEAQALHSVSSRLRAMCERVAELAALLDPPREPPGPVLERIKGWLGFRKPEPPMPPQPELLPLLRSSPLLSGLSEQGRVAMAKELGPVQAEEGAILVEEGTFSREAWMVGTGRVGLFRKVANREREQVAELGPGDLFGLVGMTNGSSRVATCVALEPCWLFGFHTDAYSRLTEGNAPDAVLLRRAVYESLADQLRMVNEKVAQLVYELARSQKLDERERSAWRDLIRGTF